MPFQNNFKYLQLVTEYCDKHLQAPAGMLKDTPVIRVRASICMSLQAPVSHRKHLSVVGG